MLFPRPIVKELASSAARRWARQEISMQRLIEAFIALWLKHGDTSVYYVKDGADTYKVTIAKIPQETARLFEEVLKVREKTLLGVPV